MRNGRREILGAKDQIHNPERLPICTYAGLGLSECHRENSIRSVDAPGQARRKYPSYKRKPGVNDALISLLSCDQSVSMGLYSGAIWNSCKCDDTELKIPLSSFGKSFDSNFQCLIAEKILTIVQCAAINRASPTSFKIV